MVTNDALWKGIIEDLLEDFLTFFFPDVEFDLSRETVFLEKELVRRKVEPNKIRSLSNYIRFYVRLNDEALNQIFEKEVIRLTGNKNTMGVEEILLQQAEDRGLKKGIEKGVKKGVRKGRFEQLYMVAKKLILTGESDEYICDLLDVEEQFVKKIRKELTG